MTKSLSASIVLSYDKVKITSDSHTALLYPVNEDAHEMHSRRFTAGQSPELHAKLLVRGISYRYVSATAEGILSESCLESKAKRTCISCSFPIYFLSKWYQR